MHAIVDTLDSKMYNSFLKVRRHGLDEDCHFVVHGYDALLSHIYTEVLMEKFATLVVPAFLILGLLRIIALPIRWFWKLSINSACGFLCLWLLNSVAAFTGLYFPVNAATVVAAGFLGLPGICALAIIQFFL